MGTPSIKGVTFRNLKDHLKDSTMGTKQDFLEDGSARDNSKMRRQRHTSLVNYTMLLIILSMIGCLLGLSYLRHSSSAVSDIAQADSFTPFGGPAYGGNHESDLGNYKRDQDNNAEDNNENLGGDNDKDNSASEDNDGDSPASEHSKRHRGKHHDLGNDDDSGFDMDQFEATASMRLNPDDSESKSSPHLHRKVERLANYMKDFIYGKGNDSHSHFDSNKLWALNKYKNEHSETPINCVNKWITDELEHIMPGLSINATLHFVEDEWHRLDQGVSFKEVNSWPKKMKKVILDTWDSYGDFLIDLDSDTQDFNDASEEDHHMDPATSDAGAPLSSPSNSTLAPQSGHSAAATKTQTIIATASTSGSGRSAAPHSTPPAATGSATVKSRDEPEPDRGRGYAYAVTNGHAESPGSSRSRIHRNAESPNLHKRLYGMSLAERDWTPDKTWSCSVVEYFKLKFGRRKRNRINNACKITMPKMLAKFEEGVCLEYRSHAAGSAERRNGRRKCMALLKDIAIHQYKKPARRSSWRKSGASTSKASTGSRLARRSHLDVTDGSTTTGNSATIGRSATTDNSAIGSADTVSMQNVKPIPDHGLTNNQGSSSTSGSGSTGSDSGASMADKSPVGGSRMTTGGFIGTSDKSVNNAIDDGTGTSGTGSIPVYDSAAEASAILPPSGVSGSFDFADLDFNPSSKSLSNSGTGASPSYSHTVLGSNAGTDGSVSSGKDLRGSSVSPYSTNSAGDDTPAYGTASLTSKYDGVPGVPSPSPDSTSGDGNGASNYGFSGQVSGHSSGGDSVSRVHSARPPPASTSTGGPDSFHDSATSVVQAGSTGLASDTKDSATKGFGGDTSSGTGTNSGTGLTRTSSGTPVGGSLGEFSTNKMAITGTTGPDSLKSRFDSAASFGNSDTRIGVNGGSPADGSSDGGFGTLKPRIGRRAATTSATKTASATSASSTTAASTPTVTPSRMNRIKSFATDTIKGEMDKECDDVGGTTGATPGTQGGSGSGVVRRAQSLGTGAKNGFGLGFAAELGEQALDSVSGSGSGSGAAANAAKEAVKLRCRKENSEAQKQDLSTSVHEVGSGSALDEEGSESALDEDGSAIDEEGSGSSSSTDDESLKPSTSDSAELSSKAKKTKSSQNSKKIDEGSSSGSDEDGDGASETASSSLDGDSTLDSETTLNRKVKSVSESTTTGSGSSGSGSSGTSNGKNGSKGGSASGGKQSGRGSGSESESLEKRQLPTSSPSAAQTQDQASTADVGAGAGTNAATAAAAAGNSVGLTGNGPAGRPTSPIELDSSGVRKSVTSPIGLGSAAGSTAASSSDQSAYQAPDVTAGSSNALPPPTADPSTYSGTGSRSGSTSFSGLDAVSGKNAYSGAGDQSGLGTFGEYESGSRETQPGTSATGYGSDPSVEFTPASPSSKVSSGSYAPDTEISPPITASRARYDSQASTMVGSGSSPPFGSPSPSESLGQTDADTLNSGNPHSTSANSADANTFHGDIGDYGVGSNTHYYTSGYGDDTNTGAGLGGSGASSLMKVTHTSSKGGDASLGIQSPWGDPSSQDTSLHPSFSNRAMVPGSSTSAGMDTISSIAPSSNSPLSVTPADPASGLTGTSSTGMDASLADTSTSGAPSSDVSPLVETSGQGNTGASSGAAGGGSSGAAGIETPPAKLAGSGSPGISGTKRMAFRG